MTSRRKKAKYLSMTGISKTKCLLIFILCMLWVGNVTIKGQAVTRDSAITCDSYQNYSFDSNTDRNGYWVTSQGFADIDPDPYTTVGPWITSSPHAHTDFTNIGFGKNVFEFWQYANTNPNPRVSDWKEHELIIYNTQVNAGNDITVCSSTSSYILNGSDPALFPGSVGTWSVTPNDATFDNSHLYNTTIRGLKQGKTYTLTWSISGLPGWGGCPSTKSDQLTLTVRNPPNAYAGNDQTICIGSSATLTASVAGYPSYVWSTSPPLTTQSITVSPTVTTSYRLTITDVNGCQSSDTVKVNVIDLASFNLTDNAVTSYCAGGAGDTLFLSGSEIGVNYQLLKNNSAIGIPVVAGTGGQLAWTNCLAGNYTVRATKGTCSKDMNGAITVSENPLPSLFNLVESSATYCSNVNGITLTLSNSENGTNFKYQLKKNGSSDGTPQDGTGNPLTWSNKLSGSYQVTATNTLTGCTATMNGNPVINSITAPSVFSIGGGGSYCENAGGLPLNLDDSELGMNYQLVRDGLNYGASKPGTGNQLDWAGIPDGNYTILATNAGNTCSRTMNGSVTNTEIPLPTVYNVSASASSYCAGSGGVTINLSGSQAGINYTLLRGATPVATKAGTGAAISWPGVTQGTYTIQAATTGALTCTVNMNGSPVITENALPVVNAGADQEICQGQSVQLSTSGGASYSWFPTAGLNNPNIANPLATPSATTLYTVTVTDVNGCTNSDQVGITVKAVPTIGITANSSICAGNNISLNATGGVTYLWNTLANTADITVSPSTTTTYQVTVTNAENCNGTANVTVTVNPKPVIVINKAPANLNCVNSTVQLSGNSAGCALAWTGPVGATFTGGTAIQNPFVDKAGRYTLTVTDANGCVSSDFADVIAHNEIPADVAINNTANLTCAVKSLTLTGSSSTPGVSWLWSASNGGVITTPTGNSQVTISAPGDYTLKVTHPLSFCTKTVTKTLTIDSTKSFITHVHRPSPITCSQTTSTLNSTVTPAGSTLVWTGPGNIDNPSIENPTVDAIGIYTLTVTNPNTGCVIKDTISVSDGRTPANVSIQTPKYLTCSRNPLTITGSTTLGTLDVDYSAQWTTADGTFSGVTTNPVVQVQKKGTYTLTITNKNSGCTAAKSILVSDSINPPIIAVDRHPLPLTCKALTIKLYGTTTTPGATLKWTGPAGSTITGDNTSTPVVNLQGTYTLTVTGKNGCSDTALVVVEKKTDALPVPQIKEPDKITCTRTTVNLEVDNTVDYSSCDYLWSTAGSGQITNPTFPVATVNAVGIYKLRVTDRATGCYTETTKTVSDDMTKPAVPVIAGGPAYVLSCTQTTLNLDGNASAGVNPVWTASNGGRVISGGTTTIATVDAPGRYTLTMTNAATGCTNSTYVDVTAQADLPTITFDPNPATITCTTPKVTLSGRPDNPAHTYSWSASPGTIVAGTENSYTPQVTTAGNYTITVLNPATGCTSSRTIVVKSSQTPPTLSIAVPDKITCTRSEVQITTSTVNADVSYLWTPDASGTIKAGYATSASPVVTSAGKYFVTITDNTTGCTTAGNVTIAEDKTSPAITLDKTSPKILTCASPEVTFSASSTTAGATFAWTGAGILFPGQANARANLPGVYSLTVTNPANGCTATDNITVTQDIANPNVSIDPPAVLTCAATSITLKGNSTTPNVTYSWSGPGALSDPSIKEPSVSVPGLYTLTVTSMANGCQANTSVTVTQSTVKPAAPVVTTDKYKCFNSPAATLTAAGNNIKWYTDPALTAASKVQEGNTFTPSGFTAVGSYNFYVTQTDPVNSCTSAATVVPYSVLALPAAPSVTNKSVCFGSSNPGLEAAGTYNKWYSVPGGAVIQTGGLYVPPVSVSAVGTYTYYVTETDSKGCQSALSPVTLTIKAVPLKPAVNSTLVNICEGSAVPAFTASGSNINWYDNASSTTAIASGTTFLPPVAAAGNYSYYVSETASGCESSKETVILRINAMPSAFNVTGGGNYCENLSGVPVGLDNSQTGITYQLYLNGSSMVATAAGTGSAFSFGQQKPAGTYTVKAVGSTGCTITMLGSVIVSTSPVPLPAGAITGSNKVCQGQNSVTYTIPAITHATSYNWTVPPGAVIASGQGTNSIVVTYGASSVSGVVTVQGINACGNGTVSSLNVQVSATPQLSVNTYQGSITCDTTSLTLKASSSTAGVSYLWNAINGGNITSGANTATPTINSAGDYIVTVTEPVNSCKTESSVTVPQDIQKPQNVEITPSHSGVITCINKEITLFASTSSTFSVDYTWTASSGGNILSGATTSTVTIDKAGVYEVTIKNLKTGCTATKSITISEQKQLPNISVVNPAAQKITCSSSTVKLSGSSTTSGITYLWSGPGSITDGTTSTPTVNKAGTYTLTVTATNGCQSTATVTVSTDSAMPFPTVNTNIDPITCSRKTVTLSGSSTVPGAILLWTGPGIVSGAGTVSPVVNKPGTYTLTATHPTSGCSQSKDVTVLKDTIAPVVSFPVVPPALTCSFPQTTITGTTTVANKTYLWTTTNGKIESGSTTASVVVSKEGTYTLAIKNTDNGCTGTASMFVLATQAKPDFSFIPPATVNCSSPSVTILGSSSTSPKTVSWTTTNGVIASGNTTLTPAVTKGGTYNVTITNTTTGCQTTGSVTVQEDTGKPVISIDKNPAVYSCGSPNVTLSGTAPNSTLLWTGPVGAIITSPTSASPTVNKPGRYILTATGANGCESKDTVIVAADTIKPKGVGILAPGTINCLTPTIQLTGTTSTPNAVFSWSAHDGGNIITSPVSEIITVNTPGTYKLVVSHPSSLCKDSTSVVVNRDTTTSTISFSAVPVQITCTQTTSQLNATVLPANSALTWTGPGSISNTGITNPVVNASGTYTLTATNPVTGCKSSRTLTVGENKTSPVISTTLTSPSVISCTDPSVTIKSSTNPVIPNYTAKWTTTGGTISGRDDLLDAIVTAKGIYTITITNNTNGCSASKNVFVDADKNAPGIMVDENPAVITCAVPEVQLFGSSAVPVSYSWTGPDPANISGATTQTPKVKTAGMYILTVTAGNGCISKDTVIVSEDKTIPAAPSILPPAQITCSVTSVNLTVSPAVAGVDYLWSRVAGTGNISNPNSATSTVDAIGTYKVTATNRISGCSSSSTVAVSELKTKPKAVIANTPHEITCALPTISIDGSASTGINPVWTATQGGHIVATAGKMATVDAKGAYTLTMTNATTGCTHDTTIQVTVSSDLPTLTVNAFPDELTCTRNSVTLSGQPTETGTTFTWTASPGNIVSGNGTYNPVVDQPGTYILKVTKTATGCFSTAAITVKENRTAPSVVITQPAKFTCTVNQVPLQAKTTSTNVSYLWSTDAAIDMADKTIASPVALAPGNYTVTVKDLTNNCTGTASTIVSIDTTAPDINVNKNPVQLSCNIKQVQLSGNSLTSGVTYAWTSFNGAGIVSPSSKTPYVDAIGYYTLTVSNPVNGCKSKDSVQVKTDNTLPNIWVHPTPDTLSCVVSSVVVKGNSSTAGVSYTWSGPGHISDIHAKEPAVDSPGTYTLSVTSPVNGCTATSNVIVVENKNKPAAPVVTGNQTCFGSPATTLTATGANVKWYSDAALTAQVNTGNNFTPSAVTNVGTTYYFVTQTTSNGCQSSAAQVTYNVLPLPAAPAIINSSVCQSLPNTALQASGTHIKWYDAPGGNLLADNTSSYTPPASINAPGTYPFYATQTDANGCQSQTATVILTIHPTPAKPVLDKLSASVCEGLTNPAFSASGNSVKWYSSPTLPAPVKTGGSFISTEITPGVYSYYVTQTSTYGCVSPYETVSFTISKLPKTFRVNGGGVYCANQPGLSVGLEGSEIGVSYQLLLNGSTVITSLAGTGSSLDFGLQKTSGDYTVLASTGEGCSTSMTGGVTISTTSLPAAATDVAGVPGVCQSASSVTYTVSPVANATSYVWSVPTGASITAGLNSNSITVDFSSSATSGVINVYGVNSCGSGAVSKDLLIAVSPLPGTVSNIKSASTFACLGQENVMFEVDPIANATDYEWVIPTGATIQYGANTRSIKIKFAPNAPTGPQILKVRGKNGCGMSLWSAPYTINVNANPFAYAGIDQYICSYTGTLQGSTIPAGGSGTWDIVKGSLMFSNNTQSNSQITSVSQGENILTWTTMANGCKSVDTVKIYNNKVNVDAGQDMPLCAQSLTLAGSMPPAGTTGTWSVGTGKATFGAASQPATSASNFGYGDNKLYWTVTKNGCKSRDSVIITNYRPTTPDAGGDFAICYDRTVLSANQPVYGTGQWTVFSGSATFADASSPVSAITTVGKGKNVLIWTITNQICSLSDTLVITNNGLDVNAGYDQTVCENRSTMDATVPPVGATGQWSVLEGSASFLDSKSPNTKISGLVTGTNKLIWSILRGSCVNTDTVTIISNEPTTPNAGADQFLSSDATVLTGNQPVIGTGKWSIISGAGTFANTASYNSAVSNLNPGANILRWTISYNGCSAYDDVTITNGTIEKVEAGPDQILCASETKLEATKPQYGFGMWTVQRGAANFENNETFNTKVTNLGPGRNVLRWTVIVSGIEFYDTVAIVNNQPTVAMVGPNQVLCGNASVLTGNVPIYGTGKWTLDGGAAIIEDVYKNNPKVTGLGTGDNLFRWTITKGTCESYTLLKITNDIPTQADAGLDESICDDKTTLIPNAPLIGTGEWSVVAGSGKFTGNEVNGLAQGKNTLRWTIRKNNCSSSDDVNIISYKPTPASAGFNTVVCVDSLFLSANKANAGLGETGRWKIMNGSGIIADTSLNTSLVKRLSSGKNVLRWTITNHGCMSSADVEVNYAYIKSIAGSDMVTCDDHIILNANNPGIGAGEWSVVGGSGTAVFVSPSSPNTEVQNLDKGKNILRWTIRNYSCASSSEVSITNNSPSEAFAGGDNAICSYTTNLDARPPLIGKGAWSVLSGSGRFIDTVAYNTQVTNVGSGTNTYRWTVTNANCVSTDEVVISNNSPINTNAGVNQTICSDSTTLAARQPLIGMGIWSIVKGAGIFKDATHPYSKIYKLAPDTNVLRWTITNKNCVDYREIKVINNLPTQATAGADVTVCSDYVMLDGNNPMTGTGEWLIISGSGRFTDKNRYNSLVQGLTRGTNVLRWKISKQGCSTWDDVTIKDDLPTQPNAGTNIAVCDNFTPLNANKPAAGKGYWSLVSGKGVFLDSTVYNTTILGLGQGSNILKWTITNNRCTLFDVVEVKNNLTNVYAGPDQMVFENHTLLLGNEPARGIGTWSLEAGTGNITNANNFEASVSGLSEGANTFTWSVNIDGCISTDRVIVNYFIYPTASFAVNSIDGCPPFKVNFTKTTVEKYPFKWTFGYADSTSVSENPSFTYPYPGSYTARLTVTAPDGKEVSREKVITVHELPKVSFEAVPRDVFIPGQPLRCYNYSDPANSYIWEFGDGESSRDYNSEHTYRDSGVYNIKLIAITPNNCIDSLVLLNGVHVMEKSRIKFPSAFTPNLNGSSSGRYNPNDFSNDVFYPTVMMGDLQEYHLEIYNRWGVLLFKSDDINTGWDGYYNGRLLTQDVYIYRASGVYNDGKKFSIIGDVLLMRR